MNLNCQSKVTTSGMNPSVEYCQLRKGHRGSCLFEEKPEGYEGEHGKNEVASHAAEFIREWFQQKWGVAPALLGFPEMKPNLSVGEMAELMDAYKKASTCKFCDCPYPM